MALVDLIEFNLEQFGIEPFGITMPVISKKWIDSTAADVSGSVTLNESDLSLTSSATNWLAPMAGRVRRVDTTAEFKAPVSLFKTDGSAVNEEGLLLIINPQAYLRLCRLYARLFEEETTFNPLRPRGYALRPVPKYFFFAGTVPADIKGGQVFAADDLGFSGTLTLYDENGWIIDPMAVTNAFENIIDTHEILDKDDGAPDQINSISGLRSADSFKVRLVQPDGSPHDGTHLMDNLSTTGGDASRGIFSVNTYSGTEPDVLREIIREAGTGNSGSFPDEEANRMLIGLTSYGRLGNRIRIPTLPGTTTLTHDFFTIKVVELKKYLLGTPTPTFNGSQLEPKPKVRINEVMHFLPDGNSLMGRLEDIFSGTPDDALLVGETIASDFPLPDDAAAVHWPDFPEFTGTAENTDFPSNLKEQLIQHSTAQLIDSGGANNVDVLLTLTGVPLGSAVRVYNRRLGTDFVEERGDGAGNVVTNTAAAATDRTYNGTLQLALRDPLGLRNPDGTFVAAVNPILNVDLIIVRQDGRSRIFGNIQLNINTVLVTEPADATDNGLLAVARRGTGRSGLHGLPSATVDLGPTPNFLDQLNAALQLEVTDATGRDAPRLPLMVRRDLLAAARSGTAWQGALSGGRVTRQLHSAETRRGCPGSRGDRETQSVGFFTQNGRLAYDIARHAFRRTESGYTRIPALDSNDWDEPAEPTALADGAEQDANSGPFAGAILQNVSPFCETPELALLKSVVESNVSSIPSDFDALVSWLTTEINNINTSSLPSVLNSGLSALKTQLVNWLNNNGATLSDTLKGRLYDEIIRELSASCFGRRDSLWALEEGIKSARHFIYIETPALGPTRYGTAGAEYSKDLLNLIQSQIDAKPGLHVMICLPKEPEYAVRYSEFQRREIFERFRIFAPTVAGGSTTTPVLSDKRVVTFHPMGFPGRPSALENQVVIVDDQWMLLGSSTFRRRGLTFDGSTDLVMTAYDTEAGVSPVIRDFRKHLLRSRLALGTSNKTTLENSNTARIDDGKEAFYVIREMLRADGYGLIERLWDGKDPHIAYTEPTLSESIWNPEGQTYQAGLAALIAWLLSSGHSGTTFHDV
jgi:hypothetical protein